MILVPNKDESREDFIARCLATKEFTQDFENAEFVAGRLYDNRDEYERASLAIVSGVIPSQRLLRKFRQEQPEGKTYTWEVEVFAVGTWNGYPFKKEDLEKMVESYSILNGEGVLDAPLKFGHNDEQPMTDGYPALGWIDELFIKDGEDKKPKLWARFVDVPEIVYKAAQSKRYRKVSIELEFDVNHKGRMFPYVITGIALLGADLPAVNTLADLNAYMGRDHLVSARRESFSAVSGNLKEEKHKMPEIDDKELEELRKKAAKADAAEAEVANFQKKENDRVVKEARDKVNGVLDKAVTDLRITPAQRASFAKVLKVDDDEAVVKITTPDVEALFPEKKSDDKGRTYGRDESDDGKSGDTDDILDTTAKKLVAESGGKMKYSRALELAMQAHPDEAKQHLGLGQYAGAEE